MTASALPPWALSLVALLVAAFALAVLGRLRARLPTAPPGPRSLHAAPTPRVGGVAIWAGFLPAALLAPPALPGPWSVWLLALAAVAMVSLIDDWRGVHPIPRLAVHLLAAFAIGWWLVPADAALPRAVELALVAFVLVWAANLYNFMDGSDGLAAAMGAFGFGAYGIAATMAQSPAASYFALAAAALAFFAINFPPARMFMGDVGAVALGMFAAACGLGGWRTGSWPAWFPLLVFLPFVADATLTLGKRVWRRERIWEAHRDHYYQRLNRLGAGHRGTLLAFGVLMTGTSTSALATLVLDREAGWVVTAAWALALAAFFAGIDYHWRHRSSAHR